MRIPMKTIPGYYNSKPGIQVGTKLIGTGEKGAFLPEDYLYLRQMGVEWVMIDGFNQEPDVELYTRLRKQTEDEGLKIYRLGNNNYHNMDVITLNLPGRDQKMEAYINYIRALGAAGIHYSTYAHMANGIWRSGETMPIRGGANGRGTNLNSPDLRGHWNGKIYDVPLSHGREYSEEELWDNYAYFIRRVAKAAEDAGVFIGIHPDDPPVYTLGGIPRKIFGTFEGYKKAIEIADSPNIGMCLCCGCWLEGGDLMGKDVYETIRYFAGINKLFKLHVRNVTAPMDNPSGFAETYPNDGYGDTLRILEELADVGFDGCIMNDHLPPMVGGRYACESYQTAYLMGAVDGIQRGRTQKG